MAVTPVQRTTPNDNYVTPQRQASELLPANTKRDRTPAELSKERREASDIDKFMGQYLTGLDKFGDAAGSLYWNRSDEEIKNGGIIEDIASGRWGEVGSEIARGALNLFPGMISAGLKVPGRVAEVVSGQDWESYDGETNTMRSQLLTPTQRMALAADSAIDVASMLPGVGWEARAARAVAKGSTPKMIAAEGLFSGIQEGAEEYMQAYTDLAYQTNDWQAAGRDKEGNVDIGKQMSYGLDNALLGGILGAGFGAGMSGIGVATGGVSPDKSAAGAGSKTEAQTPAQQAATSTPFNYNYDEKEILADRDAIDELSRMTPENSQAFSTQGTLQTLPHLKLNQMSHGIDGLRQAVVKNPEQALEYLPPELVSILSQDESVSMDDVMRQAEDWRRASGRQDVLGGKYPALGLGSVMKFESAGFHRGYGPAVSPGMPPMANADVDGDLFNTYYRKPNDIGNYYYPTELLIDPAVDNKKASDQDNIDWSYTNLSKDVAHDKVKGVLDNYGVKGPKAIEFLKAYRGGSFGNAFRQLNSMPNVTPDTVQDIMYDLGKASIAQNIVDNVVSQNVDISGNINPAQKIAETDPQRGRIKAPKPANYVQARTQLNIPGGITSDAYLFRIKQWTYFQGKHETYVFGDYVYNKNEFENLLDDLAHEAARVQGENSTVRDTLEGIFNATVMSDVATQLRLGTRHFSDTDITIQEFSDVFDDKYNAAVEWFTESMTKESYSGLEFLKPQHNKRLSEDKNRLRKMMKTLSEFRMDALVDNLPVNERTMSLAGWLEYKSTNLSEQIDFMDIASVGPSWQRQFAKLVQVYENESTRLFNQIAEETDKIKPVRREESGHVKAEDMPEAFDMMRGEITLMGDNWAQVNRCNYLSHAADPINDVGNALLFAKDSDTRWKARTLGRMREVLAPVMELWRKADEATTQEGKTKLNEAAWDKLSDIAKYSRAWESVVKEFGSDITSHTSPLLNMMQMDSGYTFAQINKYWNDKRDIRKTNDTNIFMELMASSSESDMGLNTGLVQSLKKKLVAARRNWKVAASNNVDSLRGQVTQAEELIKLGTYSYSDLERAFVSSASQAHASVHFDFITGIMHDALFDTSGGHDKGIVEKATEMIYKALQNQHNGAQMSELAMAFNASRGEWSLKDIMSNRVLVNRLLTDPNFKVKVYSENIGEKSRVLTQADVFQHFTGHVPKNGRPTGDHILQLLKAEPRFVGFIFPAQQQGFTETGVVRQVQTQTIIDAMSTLGKEDIGSLREKAEIVYMLSNDPLFYANMFLDPDLDVRTMKSEDVHGAVKKAFNKLVTGIRDNASCAEEQIELNRFRALDSALANGLNQITRAANQAAVLGDLTPINQEELMSSVAQNLESVERIFDAMHQPPNSNAAKDVINKAVSNYCQMAQRIEDTLVLEQLVYKHRGMSLALKLKEIQARDLAAWDSFHKRMKKNYPDLKDELNHHKRIIISFFKRQREITKDISNVSFSYIIPEDATVEALKNKIQAIQDDPSYSIPLYNLEKEFILIDKASDLSGFIQFWNNVVISKAIGNINSDLPHTLQINQNMMPIIESANSWYWDTVEQVRRANIIDTRRDIAPQFPQFNVGSKQAQLASKFAQSLGEAAVVPTLVGMNGKLNTSAAALTTLRPKHCAEGDDNAVSIDPGQRIAQDIINDSEKYIGKCSYRIKGAGTQWRQVSAGDIDYRLARAKDAEIEITWNDSCFDARNCPVHGSVESHKTAGASDIGMAALAHISQGMEAHVLKIKKGAGAWNGRIVKQLINDMHRTMQDEIHEPALLADLAKVTNANEAIDIIRGIRGEIFKWLDKAYREGMNFSLDDVRLQSVAMNCFSGVRLKDGGVITVKSLMDGTADYSRLVDADSLEIMSIERMGLKGWRYAIDWLNKNRSAADDQKTIQAAWDNKVREGMDTWSDEELSIEEAFAYLKPPAFARKNAGFMYSDILQDPQKKLRKWVEEETAPFKVDDSPRNLTKRQADAQDNWGKNILGMKTMFQTVFRGPSNMILSSPDFAKILDSAQEITNLPDIPKEGGVLVADSVSESKLRDAINLARRRNGTLYVYGDSITSDSYAYGPQLLAEFHNVARKIKMEDAHVIAFDMSTYNINERFNRAAPVMELSNKDPRAILTLVFDAQNRNEFADSESALAQHRYNDKTFTIPTSVSYSQGLSSFFGKRLVWPSLMTRDDYRVLNRDNVSLKNIETSHYAPGEGKLADATTMLPEQQLEKVRAFLDEVNRTDVDTINEYGFLKADSYRYGQCVGLLDGLDGTYAPVLWGMDKSSKVPPVVNAASVSLSPNTASLQFYGVAEANVASPEGERSKLLVGNAGYKTYVRYTPASFVPTIRGINQPVDVMADAKAASGRLEDGETLFRRNIGFAALKTGYDFFSLDIVQKGIARYDWSKTRFGTADVALAAMRNEHDNSTWFTLRQMINSGKFEFTGDPLINSAVKRLINRCLESTEVFPVTRALCCLNKQGELIPTYFEPQQVFEKLGRDEFQHLFSTLIPKLITDIEMVNGRYVFKKYNGEMFDANGRLHAIDEDGNEAVYDCVIDITGPDEHVEGNTMPLGASTFAHQMILREGQLTGLPLNFMKDHLKLVGTVLGNYEQFIPDFVDVVRVEGKEVQGNMQLQDFATEEDAIKDAYYNIANKKAEDDMMETRWTYMTTPVVLTRDGEPATEADVNQNIDKLVMAMNGGKPNGKATKSMAFSLVRHYYGQTYNKDIPSSNQIYLSNLIAATTDMAARIKSGAFPLSARNQNGRFSVPILPKHFYDTLREGGLGNMSIDEMKGYARAETDKVIEMLQTADPKQRKALEKFIWYVNTVNGDPQEGIGRLYGDITYSDRLEQINPLTDWLGVSEQIASEEWTQHQEAVRKKLEEYRTKANKYRYVRMPELETIGGGVTRRVRKASVVEQTLKNLTNLSRTFGTANPVIALSNLVEKGVGSLAMKGMLSIGTHTGFYNTKIMDEAATAAGGERGLAKFVTAISKDRDMQALYKSFRAANILGNTDEFLSSVLSGEMTITEWEKRFDEDKGVQAKLNKIYDIGANFASGGNSFAKAEIELFVKALMMRLGDANLPAMDGRFFVTGMEQNPAKFILDLYRRDPTTINQAMNWSLQADMAQPQFETLLIKELCRSSPVFEFAFTTGFSKFFQYQMNALRRSANLMLPISSLNALMTKALSKTKLDSKFHFSDIITERSFKEAFLKDAMMMGTGWMMAMFLVVSGIIQPPDDEDKDNNINEWLLFGMPISENWWLQDLFMTPLGLAASIYSGDFSILINAWGQSMRNNPLMKISDFGQTLMGWQDEISEEAAEAAVKYQELGMAPSALDIMVMKLQLGGAGWINQFLMPSFVAQVMNSMEYLNPQSVEKSSTRVYQLDANGNRVIDPDTGLPMTVYTSWADAQVRAFVKNRPALAWLMDMRMGMSGSTGFTSYGLGGRPNTVYSDPLQMESVKNLSFSEDATEAEKNYKIGLVINALNSTDDMEALYASGFFIPFETKKAVADFIWGTVSNKRKAFNEWMNEYGDYYYWGDYETGREIVQAAKDAYRADIAKWESLYYDKLSSEPMTRGMQLYNRMKTSYAVGKSGKLYATGMYQDSLIPFNVKYDPGTYDMQVRSAVNPDMLTGERGLIPVKTIREKYEPKIPEDTKVATARSSGSRRSGGGGGGSSPNIYSHLPSVNFQNPDENNGVRMNDTRFDYLRPGVTVQGSRDAAPRNEI